MSGYRQRFSLDETSRSDFGDMPQTYQGTEVRMQLRTLGVMAPGVVVPMSDGGIGEVERRVDEEDRVRRLEKLTESNPEKAIQLAFYSAAARLNPNVRVKFHGVYVRARTAADIMGDRLLHDEDRQPMFGNIPREPTRFSRGKLTTKAPSMTAEEIRYRKSH